MGKQTTLHFKPVAKKSKKNETSEEEEEESGSRSESEMEEVAAPRERIQRKTKGSAANEFSDFLAQGGESFCITIPRQFFMCARFVFLSFFLSQFQLKPSTSKSNFIQIQMNIYPSPLAEVHCFLEHDCKQKNLVRKGQSALPTLWKNKLPTINFSTMWG